MPVAKLIPMPIIAAILFIVAYNMSEWREFVAICKTKKISNITVLAVAFLLTVILNLVIAIFAGVLLTLLFYIIHRIKSKETRNENDET
jgi:SulP family sulfate permease